MRRIYVVAALLLAASCGGVEPTEQKEDSMTRAKELAHRIIIADTHVDIPYRLGSGMEDISRRTETGDFDYPRAVEGGLDAPFMSIYIPASYQESGGAKEFADELIDMVEQFEKDWPEKFVVARSVADVKSAFEAGKIALPMGMENGEPVEGSLDNVRHFRDRGIRYITLTHSLANHICDSSYDPDRKWGGLSPFGKELIPEMNRLGIMVDISHVSDETFEQVLELAEAPVIASHSSLRHFTPGWERNMSDQMVKKLAKNGGVIQIAFGSSFINGAYQKASSERQEAIAALIKERGLEADSEAAAELTAEYVKTHAIEYADVTDVADHIDRVKELAGVDHVGFGSDFDGVGDSLPTGLKDVSYFPNLIAELLKRGYTDDEIEKIASGNILRVWSEVERVSASLSSN